VQTLKSYPAADVERMMKLHDVLLKAMARKITWWSAAEIIGVTDRTMRRWRERLEEHGYAGLADRRKGKPSDKRVPLEVVGAEALPRDLLRPEHEALSREVEGGPWHRAELHLGAEGLAGSGAGGQAPHAV